jgi:hypothetical protein
VPLSSKLTSTSAVILAFRQCLPSRCLVLDIHATIFRAHDGKLKKIDDLQDMRRWENNVKVILKKYGGRM